MEVIQTAEDMKFSDVLETMSSVLQQVALYTCSQEKLDRLVQSLHPMPATSGSSAGRSETGTVTPLGGPTGTATLTRHEVCA